MKYFLFGVVEGEWLLLWYCNLKGVMISKAFWNYSRLQYTYIYLESDKGKPLNNGLLAIECGYVELDTDTLLRITNRQPGCTNNDANKSWLWLIDPKLMSKIDPEMVLIVW